MMITLTAYKFVSLSPEALPTLQERCWDQARSCGLQGTIILSTEGIKIALAGDWESVNTFKQFLSQYIFFSDLIYQTEKSAVLPFKKLKVHIKKEIITMRYSESLQPELETIPYLSPSTLQEWYRNRKDMVLLDTRNAFEVALGTFDQAIDLQMKTFSEFPEALNRLPEHFKTKTLITFCTGGIRCEKASLLMRRRGFLDVYQLEGGILNYFSACGGDYFNGSCFVFDHRLLIQKNKHCHG